jgi:hypothetical protein
MDTWIAEALAFRAPHVEARLLDEELAGDAREASLLFDEVKKFLILSHAQPQGFSMCSLRVDAAWHEFLLFTADYARFCSRHFGRFMAHEPTTAEASAEARTATPPETEKPSHEGFSDAYTALFGEPLSPLWDDAAGLRCHRRLRRAHEGTLTFREAGEKAELVLADGAVAARCDAWAAAALRFLARHRTFYVRELPGLADADRLALCAALVRSGVLKACW